MRTINEIILHCTATEEGRDYSVKDVDCWHRRRGFNQIGYHWLIRLDGRIERGRDENLVGAHCRGHNAHSIGVCYVGGLRYGRAVDTRTDAQRSAMRRLVGELRRRYPEAKLHCHNEFADKDCPCFKISEL